MSGLTLDKLRAAMQLVTPVAPLGGLRIVVSHHLLREVIGTKVECRRTEPWFAWVLSWFGIHPFVWVSRGPIYGPAPVYRVRDTIICSPEHAAMLNELAARTSETGDA